VYLNCTDLGDGVIELSYDFSEEPWRVRAFSLDVSVNNGVITSVGNLSSYYFIYPGLIEIDPWGEVVDSSSPASGLGTSDMTIEMGGLWSGEGDAPPDVGVLLTFTISAHCDIEVEENILTGGIVFEDPGHSTTVISPGLDGALPADPNVFGRGSGTSEDPFLIFTVEQFNTIGNYPGFFCNHFRLMADMDLSEFSGTEFNIIGNSLNRAFRGSFDGNGRKIYNFSYTTADQNCVGLFGYVTGNGAEIKNLDLINPVVNVSAGDKVGSLIGHLESGTVSRCSAQSGMVVGGSCVGGLVGRNYTAAMRNCFACTEVVADDNLGGLAGRTYVELSKCYSSGSVWEYADVAGGLAGFNHGEISGSFWDTQSSGQLGGIGGTGESAVTDVNGQPTAMMQTKSTFTGAGWDFEGESANGDMDIWTIREGVSYPKLVRQRNISDFGGVIGVDLVDFAVFAAAWKSSPGNNNWNEACDLSDPNDNLIDNLDLAVFAENYLTESTSP
jgi:hypothetical protein